MTASRREPELYDFRGAFAPHIPSRVFQIVAEVIMEGGTALLFFGLVRSIFHTIGYKKKICISSIEILRWCF
jgi:hypothetical protein